MRRKQGWGKNGEWKELKVKRNREWYCEERKSTADIKTSHCQIKKKMYEQN